MTISKYAMLKKLTFLLALVGMTSTISCKSSAQIPSTNSLPPQSFIVSSQTEQNNQSANHPQVGTIESMNNGDIMCYITLVDENNYRHEAIGADFDLCVTSEQYLNKKVGLTYKLSNVSDCQSAEPCAKSRKEWLITNIEILNQ
jgi:siroheme synthase